MPRRSPIQPRSDLGIFRLRSRRTPASFLRVRGDHRGREPPLGLVLGVPIERRDHGVAAGVDRRAVADDRVELAADLPRELRRLERQRPVADEDDRLVERRLQLRRRQRRPAGRRVEAAQDVVAADDRRRVGRDDEAALVVGLGVAVRVERRGRLRQPGEERRLGRAELGEVGHAEVDVGRGGDPVRVVAVEDLVQVGRDDLLLAGLAGEAVRHPRGLDQLLGLADVAVGAGRGRVRRQEPRPDELLGDRRGAPVTAAARVLGDRGEDRRRVEARVLPERAVLGRGRRVEDEPGNLVEGDDPPAFLLERAQDDGAGPIVDDGRLVEGQRVERRRVRQVAREDADGGGRGEPDAAPDDDDRHDRDEERSR